MALQKEPTELPAAYRAFQAAFPEIWQAYDRLGAALHGGGPLDGKTREMVKLGVAVGARLEGAVHAHTRLGCRPAHRPRRSDPSCSWR